MARHYERRWVQWDMREDVHLDADGFLPGPSDELRTWARVRHDSAWDAFAPWHCLAVLGAPGLGKSTALRQVCANVPPGDAALLVDLREHAGAEGVLERVVNAHEWQAWTRATGLLHLFLDSLDEAMLYAPNVPEQLGLALERLRAAADSGLDRLRLRIACRTADWEGSGGRLAARLAKLWEGRFAGIELLPLRRSDAASAAADLGCDGGAFLDSLAAAGLSPFATSPLALRDLADAYAEEGRLTGDSVALFETQCCRLLAEHDAVREDRLVRRGCHPSESQMLLIAQRLAAATLLSGESAISSRSWAAVEGAPAADSLMPEADCAGAVGGTPASVTTEAVRQCLATRLFHTAPDGRRRFAHGAYSAFLAARHLGRSRADRGKLVALLAQEVGVQQAVRPGLRELSAWLARMRSDWFEWALEHHVESLLCGGGPFAEEDQAARLAERLLQALAAGEPVDTGPVRTWAPLRCGRLEAILQTYLDGWTGGRQPVLLALEIARDCRVSALVEPIAALALDAEADEYVREWAVVALSVLAPEDLRPLLEEPWTGRETDKLRAYALGKLWPGMTPGELFTAIGYRLAQPIQSGTYTIAFLPPVIRHGVIPGLGPEHVDAGLAWVAGAPDLGSLDREHRELVDAVLAIAATEGCVDHLARMYGDADGHEQVELRASLVRELAGQSPETKRQFVAEAGRGLVRRFGLGAWRECWQLPRLVRKTHDFAWALEHAQAASDEAGKRFWATVTWWARDAGRAEQTEEVLAAAAADPVLHDAFGPYVTDLADDSARWQLERARELPPGDEPMPVPVTETEARELRDAADAGDTGAWLCLLQRLAEAGGWEWPALASAPPPLPVFEDLECSVLDDATETARSSLLAPRPGAAQAPLPGHVPLPWLASYIALLLLWEYDRAWLESCGEAFWDHWAQVVAWCLGLAGVGESRTWLVERALGGRPAQLQDVGLRLVQDGRVSLLGLVWCPEVERLLWSSLDAVAWTPEQAAEVLRVLLEHGSSDGRRWAVEKLGDVDAGTGCPSPDAVQAAFALMASSAGHGWDTVWLRLTSAPSLWRSLVEGGWYGADGPWHRFLQAGSVEHLTELIRWLLAAYPAATATQAADSRADRALYAAVAVLEQADAEEATRALDALHRDHPEQGFQWKARRCREAAMRETPPRRSAGEVLRICDTAGVIVIGSAADLLNQVVASLERWDRGWAVWNDSFRPFHENRVSDDLEHWLNHDHAGVLAATRGGAAATRETQASRGPTKGTNRRTDILVVYRDGHAAPASVVVEVKCPWHTDLDPNVGGAIRRSLVDRYMTGEHAPRHGAFLVAWFLCGRWTAQDKGRSDLARRYCGDDLGAFRNRLLQEAHELERDHYCIRVVVPDCRLR